MFQSNELSPYTILWISPYQTWDKSKNPLHNPVWIPRQRIINCNRSNRAFYTDVDQVKSSQVISHNLAQNNPLTVSWQKSAFLVHYWIRVLKSAEMGKTRVLHTIIMVHFLELSIFKVKFLVPICGWMCMRFHSVNVIK